MEKIQKGSVDTMKKRHILLIAFILLLAGIQSATLVYLCLEMKQISSDSHLLNVQLSQNAKVAANSAWTAADQVEDFILEAGDTPGTRKALAIKQANKIIEHTKAGNR